MSVINYMEMARVTGVSLGALLTRGQQIKVMSQLLRKVGVFLLIVCVYHCMRVCVIDIIKTSQPSNTLKLISLGLGKSSMKTRHLQITAW